MPFAEGSARSFTVESVRKNAPEVSGVYGISNAREWIFIGETSNIQARLMEHLKEMDTELASRRPMGFAFERCSPVDRIYRQNALVRHFEPFCNRRMAYTKNYGR